MNEDFKAKRKVISIVLVLLAVIVIVVMAVNILGGEDAVEPEQGGAVQTPATTVEEETEVNYTVTGEGTKLNTSEEVSKDKKVGSILIERSKIVYEDGMSLLTSKVTNDGVAKDNLRFTVKFLRSDGSTIAESVGFVGQIGADEVKYIDSYITLDVTNAKDVVYELMN